MASGRSIRQTSTAPRLAAELAGILVAARGDRTRQEIADGAGVHPNTLYALERGRANPTLAYLEALGPIYGVRVELIAGEPSDEEL